LALDNWYKCDFKSCISGFNKSANKSSSQQSS